MITQMSTTVLSESKGAKRTGILLISGAAAALAFSINGLFILTWVSFSVLFALINYNTGKGRVLRSLFCFFFAFYEVLYSWFINLYPLDFAGLNNFQSVLVIIAALTLIPAVHASLMSLVIHIALRLTRAQGLAKCFVFSFSYMLGEFLQSKGQLAFPWGRLFVSQISRLEILQSASLFGSYFITFIIILCNTFLANALFLQKSKRVKILYGSLAAAVFAFNFIFGAIRLNLYSDKTTKLITVASLQGNMSSEEKWSGGVTETAINRYKNLWDSLNSSSQNKINAENTPVLFVTPETAFPLTLYRDKILPSYKAEKIDSEIKEMCRKSKAYFVIGAFESENGKTYNSLYLYDSVGNAPSAFYRKQHLVPFGEYLPFRTAFEIFLPMLTELNLFGDDLSAGNTPENLPEINGTKIGGLICFDSVFPELCRKQVNAGARLIILSTNDSWYKTSAALSQHCAHAIMRAIENNVSIIRSANTGISMNILPTGEISGSLGAQKYGSVVSTLPITSEKTLYTRTGDIILYLGTAIIAAMSIINAITKLKKKIR